MPGTMATAAATLMADATQLMMKFILFLLTTGTPYSTQK
jgi:hypothetical protein